MIKQELERLISDAVRKAQDAGALPARAVPDVPLERPQRPEHGDYASSLALRLSRSARMSPLEMAKVIAAHVEVDQALATADVAPPGVGDLRLAPSWGASYAAAGTLARVSPRARPRPLPTWIGPTGFAETYSTWRERPSPSGTSPKRSPASRTAST